jgi:hypothetical protein
MTSRSIASKLASSCSWMRSRTPAPGSPWRAHPCASGPRAR